MQRRELLEDSNARSGAILLTTGQTQRRELGFSELLDILWEARWLLVGCVLAALAFGVSYIVFSQPTYRADALVNVKAKRASFHSLTEPETQRPAIVPMNSELLLIKSRTVLGKVVDDLDLDIDATPIRFPVIGNAVARWKDGDGKADSSLNISDYAWGGERVDIGQLSVSDDYLGHPFTIVAADAGGYNLLDEDDNLIGIGQVGKTFTASFRNNFVELYIDSMDARPGTRFSLVRRARLAAIFQLQENLAVAEEGTESGMLRISLEGDSKKRAEKIVNAVIDTYRAKSIEWSSGDVEKTLAFIDQQIPEVKARMEKAQKRIEDSYVQRGSIDVSAEAQSIVRRTVDIESELAGLKRDKAVFLQKYTASHPDIVGLDIKIASLEGQLGREEQRATRVPGNQQEFLRLSREAEVSGSLYAQLMNLSQELRVVKAGPIGNVEIVDRAAATIKPVRPNSKLLLVLSVALGLLGGGGIAILRKIRGMKIDDSVTLETQFGLPVYAMLANSAYQKVLRRRRLKAPHLPTVLAHAAPHDVTIEALRSLRTTLRFERVNASNQALLITGPTEGTGKSFVAANLAVVLASAGKKVLLIDADMRKGALHREFGVDGVFGLSELLSGEYQGRVIYDTDVKGLSLLPAGAVPPNPAELLINQRFTLLLSTMLERYDEVVIDSPPVMAVTDAAVISHLVGATIMVVHDGVTRVRDVEESAKRLSQAGGNVKGFIINLQQRKSAQPYGYGYGRGYPARTG